jgi:hypothetical protein
LTQNLFWALLGPTIQKKGACGAYELTKNKRESVRFGGFKSGHISQKGHFTGREIPGGRRHQLLGFEIQIISICKRRPIVLRGFFFEIYGRRFFVILGVAYHYISVLFGKLVWLPVTQTEWILSCTRRPHSELIVPFDFVFGCVERVIEGLSQNGYGSIN